MKNFVAIYVTSTQDGGVPLGPRTHKAIVTKVATKLSQAFGGCTCTKGTGYWLSDSQGLIAEPVVIVKSYHTLETSEALAIVTPLARELKREFHQEAVSVETEQGLEFI